MDIQVCKRCRPTLDLAVLAMTSTTPELREQHLDGLLAEYHAALVGHLDAFGHDGAKLYPLEQLREDYKHSMGYALFFGFLNVQVGRTKNIRPHSNQNLLRRKNGASKVVNF